MISFRDYLREHWRLCAFWVIIAACMAGLLLYRLGSLTGGLSSTELQTAHTTVGWHGIYRQPFYLPLKLLRSLVFVAFPHFGQTLLRVPNALLGAAVIGVFGLLVQRWYNPRTAVLITILFATGSWTLHVSRLASYDILYFLALPLLLLTHSLLQRHAEKKIILFAAVFTWGMLLYTPGIIWFLLAVGWWGRADIVRGWRTLRGWLGRSGLILAALVWLPLLIYHLVTVSKAWQTWLGLPAHFASPEHIGKQLGAVIVHLFVRGPQYPELWLGRLPIISVFTLVMSLLGIYFYARNWRAKRSRLLFTCSLLGVILIGLGGPVSLSLLVPMLYIWAAAGIAYLLHEWLKVFPLNPLARTLGIGLVVIAIAASSTYDLRAYFVAWPNSPITTAVFRYHR